MGRKFTLPYALYKTQGCLNPFLAKQTGFSEKDWNIFQDALVHLFDFDASAARPSGSMAIRKIVLFKHDSELGNAPAHKLFDAVSVIKHENVEFPRSIKDYDIIVNRALIPSGITIEEIDC